LRNGGNFIGFLIDRELSEEEPRFGGPGTDQVQGVRAGLAVVRAAQRLAVDGHLCAAQFLAQIVQPVAQADEQRGRIELGKDAAEGVVRRDAMG